nr:hypothetical protein [Tanacetum cinerariifolium]
MAWLMATFPTLANTLKGPIYLRFNLPRLPNRTTPFQGETLSITGNGHHQKDKIRAKADKTEHEMESVKKSKVNPVKVKDEAEFE